MPHNIDRVPYLRFAFAIEQFRDAVDLPFAVLGQGGDRTPAGSIVCAKEWEFAMNRSDTEDARDLYCACDADQ